MIAVLFCLPAAHTRAAPGQPPPSLAPLPETIRFENFSTEDGLSQSSVFAILQDRQGFLWFGTQDGLNRYDGYRFTSFHYDPSDPDSIGHNSVLTMLEDPEGFLWLGTWGGGLNRYDPESGVFTRFRHDPDDPASLSSDTVTALALDAVGRMWVGTAGGGLNLFERSSGRFSRWGQVEGGYIDSADALAEGTISTILAAPEGVMWIGTGGFGLEGSGLYRLDLRASSLRRYHSLPDDPNSLSSDTISAVVLAPGGMLWVGTGGYNLQGRGLNHLNEQSGQALRYQHNANPESLSVNTVRALYLDEAGSLWIGTGGGGMDRLDTMSGTRRFIHYRHDSYDPTSLSADTVWSIFQDRSGVYWFGSTLGGLFKINPQVQRFQLYRNNPGRPTSLMANTVGPILEDAAGTVWIGTLGYGLDRFARQSAVFFHFTAAPEARLRQQANTYLALYEDRKNGLWAGTVSGLVKIQHQSGQVTYYRADPTQIDFPGVEMVRAILEDADGRLWVAHQYGLAWFDRDKRTFTQMEIPEAGPGTDLLLDRSGRLWLGTEGQGLFRLDLSSIEGGAVRYRRYHNQLGIPDSLADDTIVDIFADRMGGLWVATARGLEYMAGEMDEFSHFRKEDGLGSNNVQCIQEDEVGSLWISTSEGITRFDRFSGRFRSFDASDGLQGREFNPKSCQRGRDGTLYFGGTNGLSVFNPRDIHDNAVPPLLAVTSFRVYNQPVAVDLSGQTPVHLTYQQDFISLEFVALDYHDPQKNRLAYKLEGFDRDWVQADIGRYASYTNLRGGEYVFRVRGANNEGVWNEQEIAIPIVVALPYWETTWFQVGVILFAGLAVVLGVRGYLANVHNQNRRLEALVEQRTTVLRETNQRLQEEIDQRQKVEAALARKAAEEAVAAERSRLARDLHDAVTQTLFSASLTAEVLPDLWRMDPEEAHKSTEDLRLLTRGALAEMRTLLLELRPAVLTQARFEDLLRQLTESLTGRVRLPVALHVSGKRSLPPQVQVALYRIAQESLNNIVKYARSSQVCVELQMSEAGLLLSIRDNGVGFDPACVRPTSLGLRIMRERAESMGIDLTIHSAPGQGTLIEASWNDPNTKEFV